jgi:iron(III) transport system permease protein
MSLSPSKPGRASIAEALRCSVSQIDGWQLLVLAVFMLVLTPLLVVAGSFLWPQPELWKHLQQTLLTELLFNTLWLVLGVPIGTLLLGVSLAWLTATCAFPGRRIFSWALLLPMAMPAYVLAFVFIGLFDFSGVVPTQLRSWFGPGLSLPEIRSVGGVIVVLSLSLFPYVYLLARNAFLTQGMRAMEAAQSLGCNRWQGFFRVALPMARPWIAGGVLLVLMETLADFGTVSTFNYDTFTTAIYKMWFGFFSLEGAAQLSSFLVLIALVLLVAEQSQRRRRRYTPGGRSGQTGDRLVLSGWHRWLACGYCTLILAVSFLLPVAQLTIWTTESFGEEFDERYYAWLGHSLLLGLLAALLVAAVALALAYARRRHRDPLTKWLVWFSGLGYALPGSVLAVGIFIPLARLDNLLIDAVGHWLGWSPDAIFKDTVAIMLLAYLIRFLAVGHKAIDSAMQRIRPSIDEAARLLGTGGLTLLRKIHLPIVSGGLATALTLVFVDVMKEMPITLMTRPFGWDTLAVKIFELTSEGEWERAAVPALFLVAAGLLPIMLLIRKMER